MKNKLTTIIFVALGLATVSVPLAAHHGNAAYDNDDKISVAGTVTEWIWANPHCWLKLDAKDDKGAVQHWIVEASNPPDMTRQGWTKTSFKPGDEVTITLIQAKNHLPIGRFGGQGSIVLNGHPFPPLGGGDPGNVRVAPKP